MGFATAARKPEEHRRTMENALMSISAPADVRDIILDNFDQAVNQARTEGYDNCAGNVMNMAVSLQGYGG